MEGSASSHSLRAVELVKEIERNKTLPRYNEELLRQVIEDVTKMYDESAQTMSRYAAEGRIPEPAVACQVLKNMTAIQRSKRCALAYLMQRVRMLEDVRWSQGAVLNDLLKEHMSSHELDYFNQFSNLLSEYMDAEGVLVTTDMEAPPKDLYIEVRAKEDIGEVMTANGPIFLRKDTVHLLPREEVLHYIREGKLEHIL
ncbi:DNA replication complex GINS protein PSF1 [Balamuthia mandrillaris]